MVQANWQRTKLNIHDILDSITSNRAVKQKTKTKLRFPQILTHEPQMNMTTDSILLIMRGLLKSLRVYWSNSINKSWQWFSFFWGGASCLDGAYKSSWHTCGDNLSVTGTLSRTGSCDYWPHCAHNFCFYPAQVQLLPCPFSPSPRRWLVLLRLYQCELKSCSWRGCHCCWCQL